MLLRFIFQMPLVLQAMGMASVLMLVPAIYASQLNLDRDAQSFFYWSLLFSFLTFILALTVSGRQFAKSGRDQLLSILAIYIGLPLMLAVPMADAVQDASYFNVYFEMVSSVTTTGATVFEGSERLSDPIHLWRSITGWMGGAVTLTAAVLILAPMNLGGFELLQRNSSAPVHNAAQEKFGQIDHSSRIATEVVIFYTAATLVLWLVLFALGNSPLLAFGVATATISTSSILPGISPGNINLAYGSEVAVFLVMFLALSRQFLKPDPWTIYGNQLRLDQEIKLGIALIFIVLTVLFMRHWWGAFALDESDEATSILRIIWGMVFTSLSFLTTTGFTSVDWEAARAWSGLPTPGLLLTGLAILGGGVATTAGGVKLLRVLILLSHARGELEKMIFPSAVGSVSGKTNTDKQGMTIAWIFCMLFAVAIATIVLALTLTGLTFSEAIGFSVAALSTTGPLVDQAAFGGLSYAGLNDAAKSVLIAAMILGRLEILAIVALFNPDFWRR